jgi:NAD(P)-dependent dehydrogenase (short-subunit alcohol dehydrogenase family)
MFPADCAREIDAVSFPFRKVPFDMRLSGKVGIITGAGSGIGAATAVTMAQEGATLLLVDRNLDGLLETQKAVAELGRISAEILVADVSDLMVKHSRLDLVVTCAGISPGGTVVSMTEADWERVFAINVKGTYTWLHAALPAMTQSGGGAVVMVSSQLAFTSLGGNAGYIASKGAILALTKTMAVDHAKQGIRVNAVAPGVIDTPMPRNSLATRFSDPQATAKEWMARHPLNRFGQPDEVARCILFLASEESSFVAGHTLVVDGGWSVAR